MGSSVAEQQETVLATFNRVERIEAVAGRIGGPAAAELLSIADEMIDSIPSVRVSAAASLLDLSKPTIHAWCERGVLTPAADAATSVQTLDAHRLHDVIHIVRELRQLADKPGNLVEQVWYRLQDQALLESDDVREGLAAWRNGDVLDA